ncbi:hypothetical protein N8I77_013578 [Diaporthe amygdali]|uniref:Uncharacterized protein n=1 Tax=Phomopsis amygdali TaxID=1214568 RepID=A0AAD9S0Y2_PHOAM|nr:hypothetical protein N8I77_013578 [Diaporthe amygdali]
MNVLITFFMGLAALICGALADLPLAGEIQIHWTNITATTSAAFVGSSSRVLSGGTTAVTKTTSTVSGIYTHPANVSADPIHWFLYSFQAFADKHTHTAHYAFEAVIKPNTNTVLCDETVDSDGTLNGVDNAKCKAPVGLPAKNESIPATFHFAWRSVLNTLGERTYALILRSNAPGSAHACPHFPYDACWAQGVYWVPEDYIKPTGGGDRYVGPELIHLNGTYCKTGMMECVWSEYLY